jgi:Zn-dependent metalloprotease
MCNYCSIIPQRVLEKLAKEKKLKQILPDKDPLSEKFREKRARALLRERAQNIVQGSASRYVYDSKNSEDQRVALARKEGGPGVADQDVNFAYDHAGIIRKYYKEELKWDSIDDHGLDMIFNVHMGTNYNNAFWDGDDMSFGDGDGSNFIGFARALDVTGHELTHGVVQYTAQLMYDGQSGALNEHFADVFGSVIKQYHRGQDENTADWLMGDEIMGPELKGRAIRSMKEPDNQQIPLDPQPANMRDYYPGADDNHGVHINSGIPNKAFYLVAKQIGTFKAAKLWFEALKKLRNVSQFLDLYTALVDSIPALVNTGTIPATSADAVNNAFSQVGIISVPDAIAL